MIFVGLVTIGLGFLVFSRTSSLVTFYVAYAMIMLGSSAGVWLPLKTVINRCFNRKRGKAMAVAAKVLRRWSVPRTCPPHGKEP